MKNRALIAMCALAACDDDAKRGTLEVTVYGESFIEEEIPSDVFEDGWSVTFSAFLVTVSDVRVGTGGDPAISAPEARVFDLTRPSEGRGHRLTSATVPGGRYDDTAFTIAPATSSTVAGNATADDVARLVAANASILVEGEAQKGNVIKTFSWAFTTRTTYVACESVARVDGGTHQTQITIHANHLFYDSLVSEEPAVRFDLIASADADDDGQVTLAELAAIDITTQSNYGVGNRTDIRDLAAFIAAKSGSVGHIDGEGHCHTE